MTNEETIYMPNTQGNSENTIEQPRKGLKTGWKRVAIGGVSGVMIGSAAAYAATHFMGQNNDEPSTDETAQDADHKMAQIVNDDMSFDDAFAAAREEVGPGGVFTWRGNVYGTFTTDEWEAMTPQEQMDYFADISGQDVPEHVAQPQVQEVHHYHHTVADQPAPVTEQHDQYIPNQASHSTDDGSVRVVGEDAPVQLSDGTVVHQVPIEVEGHAGIIVGTEEPEVVIIDINDNLKLDPNDVIIDLHSGDAQIVGDFAAQAEMQQGQAYVSTEDSVYDPNVHAVSYEENYADPTDDPMTDPMADPMNDPMADPGMSDGLDMATDVPLIEC